MLSAASNSIGDSSLEAISRCSRLRELYLRSNSVQKLESLLHLVRLKERLTALSCDENPCAQAQPGLYRRLLLRLLPKLVKLDQTTVGEGDFKEAHADDSPAMESLLARARLIEMQGQRPAPKHESIMGSSGSKPGASSSRPGSATPGALLPALLLLLGALTTEADVDRVVAAAREAKLRLSNGSR